MSRLTRDGTAEPVSRDQILRHARGQGNIIFPVQLTTGRIGNLTRLIHTLLYVMIIHTYILWQSLGAIFERSLLSFKEKYECIESFRASPRQGKESSQRLGGNIGCEDKTSSWHLIEFPDGINSNIKSTAV